MVHLVWMLLAGSTCVPPSNLFQLTCVVYLLLLPSGSIGIGESSHCIISKAIVSMVKTVISKSAGNFQLCDGQEAGCEATVHAM